MSSFNIPAAHRESPRTGSGTQLLGRKSRRRPEGLPVRRFAPHFMHPDGSYGCEGALQVVGTCQTCWLNSLRTWRVRLTLGCVQSICIPASLISAIPESGEFSRSVPHSSHINIVRLWMWVVGYSHWQSQYNVEVMDIGELGSSAQDDCKVLCIPLMVSLSNHRWLERASFDKLRMSKHQWAALLCNRPGPVPGRWNRRVSGFLESWGFASLGYDGFCPLSDLLGVSWRVWATY